MAEPVQVRARWDAEARVWWAESDNLPGLVTEAETQEALKDRLLRIVPDLLQESPDLALQFDHRIKIIFERQEDLAFA